MVFTLLQSNTFAFSGGSIGPEMEIEGFIESYNHVESIDHKFGP